MNATDSATQPQAAQNPWMWDFFPAYRLDKGDLENYLRQIFGAHLNFYVSVSGTWTHARGLTGSLLFRNQLEDGKYRMWIPRLLEPVSVSCPH